MYFVLGFMSVPGFRSRNICPLLNKSTLLCLILSVLLKNTASPS
jgi:hypothetical protein